jgi:hypothetical protein
MKKIYFATWNKQKLERMQLLCSSISDDFIVERVQNIIEIEENWATPIENAIIKVSPYENLEYPVIAWDTGLYFDNIDFDPTHVKRVALQQAWKNTEECTQEEICNILLQFYQKLATDNGWELPFHYTDGFAIKFTNWIIKTYESIRKNILTDISHWKKQLYFPMSNLYKSQKTWKYYMDWTKEDMLAELSDERDNLKLIYNEL